MGTTIFPNGNGSTNKVSQTFTGDVFVEMIEGNSKVGMANVTFNPCARTYWHTHEEGQVLKVLSGSGWVCDKGEEPKRINAGDVIWAAPGTTHWHGADDKSVMTHLAVGLGKCEWLDPVTDEDYFKKNTK